MTEALFTERSIFDRMSAHELTEYILEQAEKIAQAERGMRLANDALNANGTSIELQLDIYRHDTNIISPQGD